MLLDAAVPTGYLNLPDFEEVLERYFAGNLDDDSSIDLTRLYLPLSQLIPGKPLLSQSCPTCLPWRSPIASSRTELN
jgi:hypothetical protein